MQLVRGVENEATVMGSSEDFVFEFVSALDSLTRCDEKLNEVLMPFLRLKTWCSQDKEVLLQTLAGFMLAEDTALHVTKHFKPIILEILQRCAEAIVKDEKSFYINHESFSFILSILLPVIPNIQAFVLEYYVRTPSFYIRLLEERTHIVKDNEKLLKIIKTAYNFLNYDFETFIDVWNWSIFFGLLQHDHTEIRWLTVQLVAMVTQMNEKSKLELIGKLFSVEERNNMTLEMAKEYDINNTKDFSDLNSNSLTKDVAMETDNQYLSGVYFTKEDFTGNHTAVSGVVLHTLQKHLPQNDGHVNSLVMIPSSKRNLHSLALAVATGSGVLLEGPVGSGKTSLVENLARMTGRTSAPLLMKVQLGDQTDSKSLLGTYVCTDTPGEFVWQAGTLLQAVQGGHWVLLEDIDYAPMDVVSVLIPLLESRTLSVPGHGNVVKAAPGFQLFATQRTHSHSGYAFHAYSNSSILDRLWTRVHVEPPSQEELTEVICQKFPDLSSVSYKLVDIYSVVSSDTRLATKDDVTLSSLSHDKRLSTTRDLMKWASRVSMATSNGPFFADAKDVFLEAQDCFGATLSKAEHRLELGMIVGAKLGLAKEKVDFFCKNYKPKIQISQLSITVGRASLNRQQQDKYAPKIVMPKFAHTRHSLVLLERVAACIKQEEPVLLVGETGTGKTSSVQNLAALCGLNLKVINMSQQSDSADLLGGFKPVEMKQLVGPVREYFEKLFCQTFSRKQNVKYLSHVQQCYAKSQWEILFKLMIHSQKAAVDRISKGKSVVDEDVSIQSLLTKWQKFASKIEHLRKQQKHAESALAFRFVEGTLVKAIRDGDWILLDEINLATPETLECLSGLLESSAGSVVLLERGDVEPIVRHDNFRLFACMNPATDVGKKDLPPGIRNRFTEIYVDELEDVNDLKTLVVDYLQGLSPSAAIVDGIVRFYLTARHEASDKLTDGTGHKPHYSLRTLCRALRYASSNPHGNALRSIYEGFCLSFLTQLDRSSHPVVESLIRTNILGHVNATSLLNQPLPRPVEDKKSFVKFEGFWINVGERDPVVPSHYVLTPAVKANLLDLARVVSGRSFPVLIQGETSVGKTSLVQWLASASGNQCVRINNHEHTDIQEYLGCYTSDHNGRLVFKEGVLVDAMRKGYWIILDELNLAPTDVLEALNRLLDDNRELFIAETQETVKAHPNFMLFATQNPPGQYGGRKVLSRAFRNRFVELHFDELPSKELEKILQERGRIPMSYAKKMVAVLLDLQARRRSSSVFAGKQGFITLRDLFRWAERYSKNPDVEGGFHDWEQHIAGDGYMLLAGRCRNPEECKVIQEVLEIHFKRKLNQETLFTYNASAKSANDVLGQAMGRVVDGFDHVVWTKSMKRLAVLVGRALQFGEPVLLVGETGCGKTTICQLFSALKQQRLYSVNCHMHSESSDFLGGLRPVRSRHIEEQDGKLQKFFEWCDGPLVLAMKDGAVFLVDEISLADDSVLERLNSVLEPERTLVLAEKGSEGGGVNDKDVDIIVAHEKFRVVATMNPGGDFGKKELSPALRNRFTEIWCPSTNNDEDLIEIIEHNLVPGLSFNTTPDGLSGIGKAMVDFVKWFHSTEFGKRFVVSIRDLLSWVRFINTCCNLATHDDHVTSDHVTPYQSPSSPVLSPSTAYLHGACLVFLDALGAGLSSYASTSASPQEARATCIEFLKAQLQNISEVDTEVFDMKGPSAIITEKLFGIKPFYIPRGPLPVPQDMSNTYALGAPTTSQNAQRLLRALQLDRPILLEGSPGVGKTSLVTAIAKASGHELVRINLSEQTDITDLFGADLPIEGAEPGMFSWRDGPLLRALKAGHWIVLDELNLASQSVLEGLNACLDHRAEVYIPELGMSFKVQHKKTRLFACQNPLNQGGGRKGLPKSFLNRFTQVYVEPLSMEDLLFITTSLYPNMDCHVLQKMIRFNMQLHQETVVEACWGKKGSPWEFNLRDVFRWCDLLLRHKTSSYQDLQHFAKLIYSDRMRATEDKTRVLELLHKVFDENQLQNDENLPCEPTIHITPSHVQVGHSFLPRNQCVSRSGSLIRPLQVLHHDLPYMESLMKCIDMNWMTILVGPRSCGKTSLVQLLAELTGTKLEVMAMNSAMDTTELLGGFEQANLNRHWEEIISEAKVLVTSTVRTALLRKIHSRTPVDCGNLDPGLLYSQWESFIKPCITGSCDEEKSKDNGSGLTAVKIDQMLQILENTARLSGGSSDEIDAVKLRVLELKTRLQSNNGNTHCGGQFEWVDGQLVDALKSGHWLLIDNVNFCSPSVLDRLNALLEPGGVLSINERGVIDGQVPAVKPHPGFRLILTMDPRFGEISRAMRNRGVEIYMSGEDEETGYDSYDLQVMLSGTGLHDTVTCHMLLAFQQEYKAKLGGSMLDLLHAATMITDLLHRGEDLSSAVMTSLNQVYVRSHVNESEKQIAEDLITTYMNKYQVSQEEESCPLQISSAPSVRDFGMDSTLATIRWHCMPLVRLLWQQHSSTQHFRHAVDLVIERSSLFDWQLRHKYLVSVLEQLKADPSKGGEMTQLVAMVTSVIQGLFGGSLMKGIEEKYQILAVEDTERDLLSHQPFDLRLSGQLCHQLYSFNTLQQNPTENPLWSLVNRLHLFATRLKQVFFERAQENSSPSKNLVKLSRDLHAGLVSMEMLPHPSVAHLMPLFKYFNDFVDRLITTDCSLDDHEYMEAVESLQWSSRLFSICTSSSAKSFSLALLSLHWQWFVEKTLRIFPRLVGRNISECPSDLMTVVKQLSQYLGTDTQLAKTHLKITSEYGHPLPFKSEPVYQKWEKLVELCHMIELSWRQEMTSQEEICLINQVKLMTSEGETVRDMLSRAMVLVLNEKSVTHDGILTESGEVEELVQKISSVVTSAGLIRTPLVDDIDLHTDDDDEVVIKVSSDNAMKMALFPLFDDVGSSQELFVVTELERLLVQSKVSSFHGNVNQEMYNTVDALIRFLLRHSTRSCHTLAMYRVLQGALLQDQEGLFATMKHLDSELMQSVMRQRTKPLVSMKIAKWAVASSRQTESEDTGGNIDSYMFNILNNPTPAKMKEDNLDDPLSSVAIGNHKEKSDQLQVLVRHLWSNADHVTNQANHERINDVNLFASKFSQVLLSLAILLDGNDVTEEVTQVAMAITQTEPCKVGGRLKELANEMFTSYEQKTGTKENLDVMKKLMLESFSHFEVCVGALKTRGEDVAEEDSFSVHNGCMWVTLGLLQTFILSPVGPVDPVEENAIELQYVRDEISDIRNELHVRFYAEELWTGARISQDEIEKELDGGRDPRTMKLTSNPLRVRQMMCKLVKTKEREIYLMTNTAVRPKSSQFGSILSNIKHYSSTIGNPQAVLGMLAELQQASSSLSRYSQNQENVQPFDVNSIQNLLQRVGSWTNSQERFISQMKKDYPLYSDVTGPFVSSAAQILFGMTKISTWLQNSMQRSLFLRNCSVLDPKEVLLPESLIHVLCGHGVFVDQSSLQLARVLTSGPTWECVQGLKTSLSLQDQESSLHTQLTSRILWTSLLQVRNHTSHQGYLNGQTIDVLLEILNRYTQQWTLAKEEEQRREQEEGNLFKYKTTSHMDEPDEEKQIQISLCKTFPTFDSEFSELMPSNSLDEVTKKLDDVSTSDANSSEVDVFMKSVDTSRICKIHELFFCDVTSCQSWMLIGHPNANELLRCHGDLELMQSCYQTAAVVSRMNETSGCYGSIRDCVWESHVVQGKTMLERLTTTDEPSLESSVDKHGKHYDIYHDINIPEVVQVLPVMTSFTKRLNELLAEWPGNPLLTQLQSFIDKILSLPVTSPLMKVLAGVELLLKNAQDWENNASRHVSIKEHLDSIIQLIIRWRKLELRCWSSLLDVATDKASSKASQWWFYIYSLVQQVFNDDNTSKSPVEVSDLIDPLQRFIESSSLGEFSARLRMLYAFCQQCVTMETTMATCSQGDARTEVSDIMLNIYSYYNQFSGAVKRRIEGAREPIEKELKGYVKIAKWNDANFWAMKQAAEKSHRTLHKFVRRYEAALSEPVRQLLMDTKTILGSLEGDATDAPRDGKLEPHWFILPDSLQISQQTADQTTSQASALSNQIERLPKLLPKMRKLCLRILTKQKYPQLVATLDDFTGEIITTVHELQSLDISSQPKEKRSGMRKHIHLRKRTSLAELFKALSSIGLSYRKGLQALNQSSIQDSSMLLPALDEKVIYQIQDGMPSALVKAVGYLGNRCQHYYYRCVARMSALNVHMASPSKELTLGDIERTKGYTHHLLRVVQHQRRSIATVTHCMSLLRLASKSLADVAETKAQLTILPPQDEIPQRMVGLMDLLTWVCQGLERSSHLLNSCPKEEFEPESTAFPTAILSAATMAHRGSETHQTITNTIQSCQSNAKKITNNIRPHAVAFESHVSGSDVGNYVLASWKHVKILSHGFDGLKIVCQNIEEVVPYFKSSFSDQGLGGSLHLVSNKLKVECEKFQVWYHSLSRDTTAINMSEESSHAVTETVETAVTGLLLGVQRIAKITEERSKENEEEHASGDEEQEREEEDLLKGHLMTHVYQNMADDVTKLDLQTVQMSVKSLISGLRETANIMYHPTRSNEDSTFKNDDERGWMSESSGIPLMSAVGALLDQFIGLTDSYLANMLSSHRTTCKMLSVLLGVFAELTEKGFCLPPEMEEEESGEGATEFEDIEDGGLGEGEGAKDVSDQIENEDQLQDAKKEGQDEDKQDNSQQQIPEEENGIEMSEDFDGAMHDVEGDEREDDKSGDEEEEEPDIDKQMGELDGKEDEKLDEKMWGDSDHEDEKEEKESESEKGAGAEAEAQSEMVAKEDNKDAVDQSKEKEQEPSEQNDTEDDINELPKEDQGNLSDEELDEQGEGRDDNGTPDNDENNDLDLPEDLEFDEEVENKAEEEGEGEEKESEADMDGGDEEPMDVDQDDNLQEESNKEEEQGKDTNEDDETENGKEEKQDGGEEPKDDVEDEDEEWRTKHESEDPDAVQAVEDTSANDGAPQQDNTVDQTAGQSEPNENQEQHGVGSAEAVGNEGHSGEAEVTSAQSADTKQKQRKQMNRSRSDRSLGSMDERTHKRLKTVDETEMESEKQSDVKNASELYQHIKDEGSKHDAQTLDSATADQTREQEGARFPEHQSDEEDEGDEEMEDSDMTLKEKEERLKQIHQQKNLPEAADTEMKAQEQEQPEDAGELDTTSQPRDMDPSADRTSSSYHVSHTALQQEREELSIDPDKLRSDLEHQLSVWSNLNHGTAEEQRLAQSAWHKYEVLTSSLAQELCEQLRLVLEPSLATKLKGDYRTGKRLNMRKVIPYIASQFRKDKIWLRRTKPSKRQYQVMIAVDDSSSMADNHSKQLAFESLAVISKALTRLEAGDLAVCSFGESVKLLHPLHEQFTDQSGAKILQQFTFDQTKTKIAQLVDTCSSLMLTSRSRMQSGPRSGSDTSQLLLVVSDGRGVFLEGMETVRRAVRAAKAAGIFLVFVVIDNPINRDSILDIKVPIFRPGKLPEIKSYMEEFPFPFYVILRDINSLPITLSDALRQWFELVTSMDT